MTFDMLMFGDQIAAKESADLMWAASLASPGKAHKRGLALTDKIKLLATSFNGQQFPLTTDQSYIKKETKKRKPSTDTTYEAELQPVTSTTSEDEPLDLSAKVRRF